MGYSAGQGGPERGDAFRRQDLQQTPHTMLASPLGAYGLPATSPYAQHLQAFNPGFGLSPEGLTQAFRGQLSPSTLPHTPGFATPDAYFRDREQLAHLQAFGHMSGGSNPNAAQQFTPGPFANPGQTQPSPRQGDPGYGPPDSVMEAEMMRRLHQGFPNAEGVPTHAAAPASQTQGGARSPPDPTPHREPPSNDAPQADHKREHMPAREENGDEGEGEGSDGTEDDFYYKKENGGVTELAQVGEDQVELPIELFDLPSLNRILSIQTWNQHLNDEERLHLLKFLPQLPDVHLQVTLDARTCLV